MLSSFFLIHPDDIAFSFPYPIFVYHPPLIIWSNEEWCFINYICFNFYIMTCVYLSLKVNAFLYPYTKSLNSSFVL